MSSKEKPFKRWFHRFGSSPYMYGLAGRLLPWFGWAAIVFLAAGLICALVLAPEDYQQGNSVKILYLHVPSALLGTGGYTSMAVAAAIGFIWRLKIGHAVAVSIAPVGASLMTLALITGALWGRPTWGTYWQWSDVRLTSSLLLVLLYLGYLALRAAFEDRDKADRVSAVLAVVGAVNVPIIRYSVHWRGGQLSQHQGQTVTTTNPSIEWAMLWPLIVVAVGFIALFGWLVLNRLRGEIVEREARSRWVGELLREEST